MMNVEKLTPVLIKFVRIHVHVEIMLSAASSITSQFVPVRRDMKETQMWPVSRWNAEWMMTVLTLMHAAMNSVAQCVDLVMLHVEEKPSAQLRITKQSAAVHLDLKVIHLSPVERLNVDLTETVPVTRLVSTITVFLLARSKTHVKE